MVSSFSVRPEQVDVLSADIANDAKGIAQELDNLDTQVKSLIEQWDGAAREAYHQAQRDWNGKLQEMNQILGQISQATSQIAQQLCRVRRPFRGTLLKHRDSVRSGHPRTGWGIPTSPPRMQSMT